MSQAKTLTSAELDHVLHYISTQSYPLRNRVMLLTGFWSGMPIPTGIGLEDPQLGGVVGYWRY